MVGLQRHCVISRQQRQQRRAFGTGANSGARRLQCLQCDNRPAAARHVLRVVAAALQQLRQRRRIAPGEIARIVGAQHADVAVHARGQHRRAAATASMITWAPPSMRLQCTSRWARWMRRRVASCVETAEPAVVRAVGLRLARLLAQRRVERVADVVEADVVSIGAAGAPPRRASAAISRRAGGRPSRRAQLSRLLATRLRAAGGLEDDTGFGAQAGGKASRAQVLQDDQALRPGPANAAPTRRVECRGTDRCRSARRPAAPGCACAQASIEAAERRACSAISTASVCTPSYPARHSWTISAAVMPTPAGATSATRSASCRCWQRPAPASR